MAAGWQEHGTRTVLEEVGCPKNKKQQQQQKRCHFLPACVFGSSLAHPLLSRFRRDSMDGPVPEIDFSAFGAVELPLLGEQLELTERQLQVGKQLYDILTTHGGLTSGGPLKHPHKW